MPPDPQSPKGGKSSCMTTAPAPDGEFARLLKPFLPWILLSAVMGIGAGAATVALLSTINQVLNRQGGLSGGCC